MSMISRFAHETQVLFRFPPVSVRSRRADKESPMSYPRDEERSVVKKKKKKETELVQKSIYAVTFQVARLIRAGNLSKLGRASCLSSTSVDQWEKFEDK